REVTALQKTLEHQRKHQSLDEHRLRLSDEEPCPLCGALDHPYATNEPHFDTNEAFLKNKESLLSSNGKLIISLEENNKFRVGEMQRIQAEIDQKTTEKSALAAEITSLLHILKWDAEDRIDVIQSKGKELHQHIKKVGSSRKAFSANDILLEIQETLLAWQKAVDNYETLKAKRSTLYTGTDIDIESNSLITNITEMLTSQKNLEDQGNKLTIQLKETGRVKTEFQTELDVILSKEGIEDLEQLRLAILPEEIAKKHRDRKNELALWKAKFSEKQTANTDILNKLTQKDSTAHSFEQLSDLFSESKVKLDEILLTVGKISQVLEDDKKTRARFKNEQKVLDALKKDQLLWKTMNDLIGDSYGNKFSNFVQDLTLEQLIGYANKRLAEFTDRYVLDIPTADEAEKSDTLKIFDTYMGNARRSVKTLSGGETFLVS
ncbi:unnamed protein product, partial [Ectocarpus sp. 12 AP-2014]